MSYKLLADAIMIAHFAWILFMVSGVIFTLCGFIWKDILDRWLFRTLHLMGIAYTGFLAVRGLYCPLTIWEFALRGRSGGKTEYTGSFIMRYIGSMVYPDMDPGILRGVSGFIAAATVTIFIVRPPAKIKGVLKDRFRTDKK